jgi:hypothetical protein
MPAYSQSPFGPFPELLVPGTSGYSFGVFSDQTPTTRLFVTNSVLLSNVATLIVQVWEGPVPVVGQLISTQGLGRIPGVSNAAVTAVTGFTDLTNGTVSYALTHANVATHADAGLALLPAQEAGETIQTAIPGSNPVAKGACFALAPLTQTNSRSIAWSVSFPGTPPSATFEADLQGALENVDSQFQKLDKITAVTGGTQVVFPVAQCNFVRIVVISNDDATSIVAKVSI